MATGDGGAGGTTSTAPYGGAAGTGLGGFNAGSTEAYGGGTVGAGLGGYGMTTDVPAPVVGLGDHGSAAGLYGAHGSQDRLIWRPIHGPGNEDQGHGTGHAGPNQLQRRGQTTGEDRKDDPTGPGGSFSASA